MFVATVLTRLLSAIPSTSYPQCSTPNITITTPASDLKSVDINSPLNLTWTSHTAIDPACLEINVHYRSRRSQEDSLHWIDTLAVPATAQWLPILFKDEESRFRWWLWKRPGARVTIEVARKKHGWEVYDRVGPFTLTDNASLRPEDKPELRARQHPINEGPGIWNDWQDDAPSTPASSVTTTVTIDSSTPPPALSAYSSTTTKTVTLELSASFHQPSGADDPLSISFALTSIPETTTTASARSTATTTLASSDFAPHTPSATTSVLSITVNPLPQSTTSISLPTPSYEARTSATAPPAASSTSSSSPATRPRPSSLASLLVSTAAALALTGTIIVGGAREVKALTWRVGDRSWSWPSLKEVKEVVKGTGA